MLEFWYIPLIILVPLFFLWTVVHESAHAMQVLILGGKVIDFKPYPCKINGTWFFGYISYKVPDLDVLKRDLISIAPYGVDALASILIASIIFGANLPAWTGILLVTIMLAPVINTANQGRLALQGRDCDLVKNGDKGGAIVLSVAQILSWIGSLIFLLSR